MPKIQSCESSGGRHSTTGSRPSTSFGVSSQPRSEPGGMNAEERSAPICVQCVDVCCRFHSRVHCAFTSCCSRPVVCCQASPPAEGRVPRRRKTRGARERRRVARSRAPTRDAHRQSRATCHAHASFGGRFLRLIAVSRGALHERLKASFPSSLKASFPSSLPLHNF